MAEVMHQTESWRAHSIQPARIAQAPIESEFVPVSASMTPGQSEYGPVRYGETLSEIAVQISGDGVSMTEMMTALFEANPEAFGDSIDLLHEGAVLAIPDIKGMREYGTLTAHTF